MQINLLLQKGDNVKRIREEVCFFVLVLSSEDCTALVMRGPIYKTSYDLSQGYRKFCCKIDLRQ